MAGILDGKSALVTGGASGIGRATALAMVREGARVAVADQSEAGAAETVAMINAAGRPVHRHRRRRLGRSADRGYGGAQRRRLGRLDCAFNNAGIAPRHAGPSGQRTHEMSRQSFDRMMAINLTGVFLCMKHDRADAEAGRRSHRQHRPRWRAWSGCRRRRATSAKHGVVGLTKTAAMEYAQESIRELRQSRLHQDADDRSGMAERYERPMTKWCR